MFKFNTFSELINRSITQEDAHLDHKADKKRNAPAVGSSSSAPQRFHLVQTGQPRASSQQQPMYRPPQYQFGYRPGHHSNRWHIGHLSTCSHRGQSELLCLSRMCRRCGCSSRVCTQIYPHASTMVKLVTLHVIAICHLSKIKLPISRTRRKMWLILSPGTCIILHLRMFQRELK